MACGIISRTQIERQLGSPIKTRVRHRNKLQSYPQSVPDNFMQLHLQLITLRHGQHDSQPQPVTGT